ncbi:tyrosine protein kinase [Croceivirga lutea]|uniref:GumC family protein n=1 Tax=Croceivirga lutea TaxID=1775167 RepID=UPI00163B0556|nr:polysaccharide biosynthesis tyrosine autokinase [Croceivirga lutea]GGG42596.1 tyrosine protein kinase [Croceivirga lutea]
MSDNKNIDLDLNGIVKLLLKKWYWFALSLFVFLALAKIYNRYATPKYSIKGQIQILEEKGASPELAVFTELDFLGGKQNAVEDEISVLSSRSNFLEVAKNLKLNVNFKVIGDVKESEVYVDTPISVNLLEADSIIYDSEFSFYVNLNSDNSFGYSEDENNDFTKMAFGKTIKTKIGEIIVTPNLDYFNEYKNQVIKVSILPLAKVAQYYKEAVKIGTIEEDSKVINLVLEEAVPQKAINILNELIRVYNANAINDKKEIADKTFTFINDRINDIASNLSNVDQSAQEFMTRRGITNIASQADVNINLGAATQQELQNAQTQLAVASSMKNMVDNQGGYDVLPSNIGLNDASIANTTSKYNQLVQERNRLLKSSNEKNPMIVNIDEQLSGLKRSLQSSLNNIENNLTLQVNNLGSRQSSIQSRIYSAPTNQRALRDITRKQETTESLYLYLLQKREESQVALASASPKSKVIDAAYLESKDPISPNRLKIYLASCIVGFLLPFSVLYLQHNLDNKIHNKSTLEQRVTDYPILAELPKLNGKSRKIVGQDDRSVLGESLRILRTNLDYLIKSKTGKHNNVVLITSSVSGEGKTFLSTNLAKILATAGKRVLLVGADIRNPKMYQYFNESSSSKKSSSKSKDYEYGLSEYLQDTSLELSDLVNKINIDEAKLDVIYSGKILPNPSELLMRDRLRALLSQVSDLYDYVLLDTAPLMLVTDTLLISPYVNHTIYVTRAGVSETSVVDYPIRLQREGKINGLAFVVNDVKNSNLGYAGKYGYGYGAKPKKWYQVFG